MAQQIVIEEVLEDLRRVQDFRPADLVQEKRLGADAAFHEAVEPAEQLINLFRKLPADAVDEFPFSQKKQIQDWSKSVYNLFDEILNFSVDEGNIAQRKMQLVQQLKDSYQNFFNHLFPLISYAVARTVDFNRLTEEGRTAVQGIKDETNKLINELEKTSESAQSVLQEVRDAAAEQGVTQQAKYFSDEASAHETMASNWLSKSYVMAFVVTGYAIASLFFPNIGWLSAESVSEAIQLTVSKVLVFFVLAFLLIQCVKNYMAHRHNVVVNRHRQNALMTYTTLAEAGSTPEARDTVLQHAAAAVYAPNDSGYTKNEERGDGGNPLIGVMPRPGIGGVGTPDS